MELIISRCQAHLLKETNFPNSWTVYRSLCSSAKRKWSCTTSECKDFTASKWLITPVTEQNYRVCTINESRDLRRSPTRLMPPCKIFFASRQIWFEQVCKSCAYSVCWQRGTGGGGNDCWIIKQKKQKAAKLSAGMKFLTLFSPLPKRYVSSDADVFLGGLPRELHPHPGWVMKNLVIAPTCSEQALVASCLVCFLAKGVLSPPPVISRER